MLIYIAKPAGTRNFLAVLGVFLNSEINKN